MNDMNMNVFKMTVLIRYSPIFFLLSRSVPTKNITVAELHDYGRIICKNLWIIISLYEKFV